ncbi:uncharacterized protein PgNI_09152 [Pyricularia grisea]|uniref:Uncharacterized protein n=1 Tax=Pyricularia grisea TaxID=148305 RepID=A0A6P8ASU3_PYRGI|nr:uncharacterized protein PgNI_09152 [Pyricularia grisea]TLD05172.1 hypothetical protein PgNI_09152 [Pyricularia grisea]
MHFFTIVFTAAICVTGAIAAPTPNNGLDVVHVGQLEARSSDENAKKEMEKQRQKELQKERQKQRNEEYNQFLRDDREMWDQSKEFLDNLKKPALDEEKRRGFRS